MDDLAKKYAKIDKSVSSSAVMAEQIKEKYNKKVEVPVVPAANTVVQTESELPPPNEEFVKLKALAQKN